MNNAHHLGIESSWECVGHLSWKDQEYVEEQREACAGLRHSGQMGSSRCWKWYVLCFYSVRVLRTKNPYMRVNLSPGM